MTPPEPEALRLAAADTMAGAADPRAREIVERAIVDLTPSLRWTGSAGDVHAHRVALGIDAASLGLARAHPAIEDALAEAFSRALAARPGETLHELVLFWALLDDANATGDYRHAPVHTGRVPGLASLDEREELERALVAYLEAGDAAVPPARVADLRLDVRETPERVEIDVTGPRLGRSDEVQVGAALRDLCRGPDGRDVRVIYHTARA